MTATMEENRLIYDLQNWIRLEFKLMSIFHMYVTVYGEYNENLITLEAITVGAFLISVFFVKVLLVLCVNTFIHNFFCNFMKIFELFFMKLKLNQFFH
jgi:hypothetical protein